MKYAILFILLISFGCAKKVKVVNQPTPPIVSGVTGCTTCEGPALPPPMPIFGDGPCDPRMKELTAYLVEYHLTYECTQN